MTSTNRRKITSILAILLCIIMCIPNVAVFAEPEFVDRTGQGTHFNLQYLHLANNTGQLIVNNGIVVWDTSEELLLANNYTVKATWSVDDVSGWNAGDYILFDLPMATVANYIVAAPQPLNDGYGRYEIVGAPGAQKVKFVLSALAVSLGTSLSNGYFETTAGSRSFNTAGETGKETVLGIELKWRALPWSPTTGDTRFGNRVIDLHKYVWGREIDTEAGYTLSINQQDAANYFEDIANTNVNKTYTQKDNVMIVDILPAGVVFKDPVNGGTFTTF